MNTAVIYCRVSGETYGEVGLKTQLKQCRNFCQSKGYSVVREFQERESGLTLARPELDDVRKFMRDEEVGIVVVYALDRLTCEPMHSILLLGEMENYYVELESVTEALDNSDLGRLAIFIRIWASKSEIAKVKERAERSRRGRQLGHHLAAARKWINDSVKISKQGI